MTPESFTSGLHNAAFPNPDSPLLMGKVGFNGRRHGMTLDAAEFWFDASARGAEDDATGALCYVDHGLRRIEGQWPAGDSVFFSPPCDSGSTVAQ